MLSEDSSVATTSLEAEGAQQELFQILNKGHAEVLEFMEESLSKVENNIQYNHQVLQLQTETIMRRVEELEDSLGGIMKQLECRDQDRG